MRCIVTAGPTFEPLDQVRRLTNFSTGRLGSELVNYLADRGHEVVLLIGQQATWRVQPRTFEVETFGTTSSLRDCLRNRSGDTVDAVFHTAAVSDFSFGTVWRRSADGSLTPVSSGKFSTREGMLLAELVPTPKIISELRGWFPRARLVGWKYEVDGDRSAVLHLAASQIRECRTDACVANGPAFGPGFGVVTLGTGCEQYESASRLFEALERFISSPRSPTD